MTEVVYRLHREDVVAVNAVGQVLATVTLAAQAMQAAGLISYRRGKIQVLDRLGLEEASCECYAIVKERFDAFLKPPVSAVQGNTKRRNKTAAKSDDR